MANESLQVKTCPHCKNPATELIRLDAKVKETLQKSSGVTGLPDSVCSSCYNSLTGQVSHGVRLRIEQQAKEKNRNMVWKSRVNLIKHARQMMQQKAYSDAAISYEKYLRVLEISYDLKKGQLSPDVFGKSARSKELNVITNTYWDLLRIYDTNAQYRDRMRIAAKKLAEFVPYSPLFPDITKRAQSYVTDAKNPDIMKEFLKLSKANTNRCFIATATYQDPFHPTVIELRLFRDHVLMRSALGRTFVRTYYFVSPPIANLISKVPFLRPASKALLELALKIMPRPLVRMRKTE